MLGPKNGRTERHGRLGSDRESHLVGVDLDYKDMEKSAEKYCESPKQKTQDSPADCVTNSMSSEAVDTSIFAVYFKFREEGSRE